MENNQEFLTQLMDMLEQHFGYTCEIVLHDLTKNYAHTIVDIRNGHITGRKIGDCGSNLGLEVLSGKAVSADRYNYITHTRDAKILRSSSLYIKDGEDVIGSICINSDITESMRFENFLHAQNNYSSSQDAATREFHATDIKQLLEHFLIEGEDVVGKSAIQMNKDDKLVFLKYLDEKGVFLITKSSDRVCEFLGISRYTLYSYLETTRGENGKTKKGKEGECIASL